MARWTLVWEDDREREAVEAAVRYWHLYGELHITNDRGLTVLDPLGVTYAPTGNEVAAASPTTPAATEETPE